MGFSRFATGFSRLATLAALGFASMMVAWQADIASAAVLAAHRAVYNLELVEASERSGIVNMYGRMVYEFSGNECQGYKVGFRFATRVETGGTTKVTDQQTTTFEDIKGGSFDFETRSYIDQNLDKQLNGRAERRGNAISVDISAPEIRNLEFANGLFPTEHMLEVIAQAQKGKNFVESRIFDGSDGGDKVLFTAAVIGKPVLPTPDDADAFPAGELGKRPTWPVTIAYFNDSGGKDEVPIYRISFKLYDNGVTRALTMHYGDFVLKGKLVELKMLQNTSCPQN